MPNDIDEQILNDIAAEEVAQRQRPTAHGDDRLNRIEQQLATMMSKIDNKKIQAPADEYEKERLALIEDENKIFEYASSITGKLGKIIAPYGAAQLVLKSGERVNGILLIRCFITGITRSNETSSTVFDKHIYEMWGYLERGNREKIGMMAAFSSDTVSCFVNLRSDMHVNASE
jgi:hypothetical protein